MSMEAELNLEDYDKIELKQRSDMLPWVEKYRPTLLNDILSHNEIIQTLKIFIKNKCFPHLLFYGPPGCGKTSTIIACAKELYGKCFNYMVMELNASNDRGIDVVRTNIKKFVKGQGAFFGRSGDERKNIFKLVILDEIDVMTTDAQSILRKIIEQYTENTRFCLICNYIQKISPALQSRCTKFRFSPISSDNIRMKIDEIKEKENINVTELGVNTIIKRAKGDMRKVVNILQSTSMIYCVVNEKNVNMCLGYPRKRNMIDCLELLINHSFEDCYTNIIRIKNENGLALNDIVTECHDIIIEYIIKMETKYDIIKKLNLTVLMKIIDKLREIEDNLSNSTVENIQVAGLIGVFKLAL